MSRGGYLDGEENDQQVSTCVLQRTARFALGRLVPDDGETWLWHDEGYLCVVYILNPGKENAQEDGIQKQNLNQMETKGEKEEEGAVQQQCLDACACSGVCGGAESHPAAVLRVVCPV